MQNLQWTAVAGEYSVILYDSDGQQMAQVVSGERYTLFADLEARAALIVRAVNSPDAPRGAEAGGAGTG